MKRATKVINMTPHDINIVGKNNEITGVYIASGDLIRLQMGTKPIGELPDGTKLTKTTYGNPEGLPEFQENVYYIVSALVKTALPERKDLLVPAEMVRNDKGQIIGCKSLGV